MLWNAPFIYTANFATAEVSMSTTEVKMSTSELKPINPRVRGFICVTAHPLGCQKNVLEQIDYVKKQGSIKEAPKKVLVIGSSTGYGLASRIVSAFAGQASTIGVFFEKPSEGGKPASAGWYNTSAFTKAAKDAGLYAENLNGDAFSNELKEQTIELIKKDLGKIDCVIYSLASPRRTHPDTKAVHNSVLKPIGQTFTAKTLDTDKGIVKDVSIDPANEHDINETVTVMGGEDWIMWMEKLQKAGVLADGVKTVAYSYIGPEVTWPVYKDGTIGRAKQDLEKATEKINSMLSQLSGKAYVSVNQAVVTQASSAIPVVPLYISLLFKVLKEQSTLEGCIEQIYRLFASQLYNGNTPKLDEAGRIRIDDLEMEPKIQKAVSELWGKVTTDNLNEISHFNVYKEQFLKLFGFGLEGVKYEEPVDPACL